MRQSRFCPTLRRSWTTMAKIRILLRSQRIAVPIETRPLFWCRIGEAPQVARSVYLPASRGLPELSDEASDSTRRGK